MLNTIMTSYESWPCLPDEFHIIPLFSSLSQHPSAAVPPQSLPSFILFFFHLVLPTPSFSQAARVLDSYPLSPLLLVPYCLCDSYKQLIKLRKLR